MNAANRNGFTLVELITVIAIVAIVAAILLPVFAKTREKARQSMCLGDIRQVGIAMVQYTQDNDEKYTGSDNYGQGWAEELYPYVRSLTVYRCPDDIRPMSVDGGIQWSNEPYQPDIISYAANVNILDPSRVQNPAAPLSQSQIVSPSTTVLLYEGNHAYAKYAGPDSIENIPIGYSNVCRLDPDEPGGPDDSSEVGDGSGDPYEVPVDILRHQYNRSTADSLVHTGWLNFLLVDGHVGFLNAGWDNSAGEVSVGDLPARSNVFSAIGQNNLAGSRFQISLNPNP